ncbi:short-chain dehydrogenase isoform A [Chlorella sorokiniana]|uniref:Short-chain dehydrogenase isoform A n=1 Tax=Chlorella sorokiniana TaxID=3076 RepID=A0A2P6TBF3_CHLSO|nr:short-chain dehydrogenase isoform A [Chlorella sorokiniana]|eukprot:PRW05888.1 short-chain dehydrogenase isoform A [Chlorella sorokiniana]
MSEGALAGPPAAVVSGANRGLGLELCRQLRQRSWRVFALCRSSSAELNALSTPPAGATNQHQAAGESGGSLTVVTGIDVASDSCVALLQAALAGVPVGLLIANAGILGVDSLAELDTAAIRSQFEVNALGPLRVVHALRPNLLPGSSKLALISSKMGSIAATREGGKAGSAGYRMSKAAANMAGQLLALELAPLGIPVVLIHPGAVTTDMYHEYWRRVGEGSRAPSGHGPISVQEAAAGVLQRVDEITPDSSGRFVQAATGEALPCGGTLRAAWAAVAAVLLAAAGAPLAAAAPGPRALSCPPSVIEGVTACSASGSVVAEANVTYEFTVADSVRGPFDVVVVLRATSGDADLLVSTPDGSEHASNHGSGADVVFLPRNQVQPGRYLITVVGASDQSHYRLSVEQHEKRRALAAVDREALQAVLEGPCCTRPGSCSSLRGGLDGFESLGRDLCNTGQNLCDVEGRLVHLALTNEYLSCPFPANLGKLERLEQLDLTMNDLTGSLDKEVVDVVTRLPALQSLMLPHNKLGGSLSCELLTSGKLAALDVTANQVQGTIPACLVEAPTMQELYLSNNRLTGSLPAPPPGSPLMIISAHSMRLTGSIPDVSQLAQLQALQLHNNGLTGGLPPMPEAMRNLNVEYNRISGTIPDQWGGLEGWEVIRLRHNKLTGTLPPGLARQEELELLLVDHNQLTGVLPTYWDAPQLARLDLQHNNLSGPLPESLGALPALTVLQASNNVLSGTGSLVAFSQAAASTSRLQILTLNKNQLDGPVPQELRSLPLWGGGFVLLDGVSIPATLELSDNSLSGPFPSWIPEALIDSSVVVNLQGNRLTCPTSVLVSQSLPDYRFEGLDCVAADGSLQPVAPLVMVQPEGGSSELPQVPPPTGDSGSSAPPSTPAADERSGESGASETGGSGSEAETGGQEQGGGTSEASTSGGSSAAPAEGSDSSGSGGGGKLPGWAIALIVVGSVAVAAVGVGLLAGPRLYSKWQDWRAGRYETYEDGSDAPSSADRAYAAKRAAVAEMAELGTLGSAKSKAAPGSSAPSAGAWGAAGAAVAGAGAAGQPGAAAAAATDDDPFQIGTTVHPDVV